MSQLYSYSSDFNGIKKTAETTELKIILFGLLWKRMKVNKKYIMYAYIAKRHYVQMSIKSNISLNMFYFI